MGFAKGNTCASAEVKRKARQRNGLQCPESLSSGEAIWRKLVVAAKDGNTTVGLKLLDLYSKHTTDTAARRPEHLAAEQYKGLPTGVATLVHSLDADIESVVRRYRSGRPCTDVEALVGATVLSLQGVTVPPCTTKTGLLGELVSVIQRMRESGQMPEPLAETWKPGREVVSTV